MTYGQIESVLFLLACILLGVAVVGMVSLLILRLQRRSFSIKPFWWRILFSIAIIGLIFMIAALVFGVEEYEKKMREGCSLEIESAKVFVKDKEVRLLYGGTESRGFEVEIPMHKDSAKVTMELSGTATIIFHLPQGWPKVTFVNSGKTFDFQDCQPRAINGMVK